MLLKGAAVGCLFGMGFGTWISVGNYLFGTHWAALPVPTSNCFSNLNNTMTIFNTTSYMTTGDPLLTTAIVNMEPWVQRIYCNIHYVQWASYEIRKIAGCACAGNAGNISPPPPVNDPYMHHGTCVTHVPWCMLRSLTSGFLWSRWRGKRCRYSRRMRNPQFYLSGKRPIKHALGFVILGFAVVIHSWTKVYRICFSKLLNQQEVNFLEFVELGMHSSSFFNFVKYNIFGPVVMVQSTKNKEQLSKFSMSTQVLSRHNGKM